MELAAVIAVAFVVGGSGAFAARALTARILRRSGADPLTPRRQLASYDAYFEKHAEAIPRSTSRTVSKSQYATRAVLPPEQLVIGVLLVVNYYTFALGPLFVQRTALCWIATVLCSVNLRTPLVPNIITMPALAVGLGLAMFGGVGWKSSILGATIGGGGLFLIAELYYRATRREAIGMGCVKLIAVIGAFLGWQLMLAAFVIGSVAGAVLAVFTSNRARQHDTVLPFAAILAGSAAVVAVVGDRLIAWYVSFY